MGLFDKIFGSYSDRQVKEIMPVIKQINELEPSMKKLTNEELRGKTEEFRERIKNGETCDDILPEAFAVVREAAFRVLGQRHYDVQLIGGIVLHQGRIAEMKTGEGKTLVSTLPAYLNALEGKGVHIVTVNDYLAKRDSEWMGKIYRFLGMTVGVVTHESKPEERQQAYASDITYGTNNELGFDYLRDNMVRNKANLVQRELHFAIVDEVDSILIDEARTPLIISGAGEKSSDMYEKADALAATFSKFVIKETDSKDLMEDVQEDYIVDEKSRTATLTKHGIEKAEKYFGLECFSDPENSLIAHHINQAIKARGVMKLDVDYVVKDGAVIIVDEFTGRLMFGRRFNDGLHQAIEAKEHVKIEKENMTLATITFQNYFRMYDKLSGMTGTALTEEEEFNEIYGVDVVEIPTNKPVMREDLPDAVFATTEAKYNYVLKTVIEAHEKGQPILIGTSSIEKSEVISKLLNKKGIQHNVLNAKNHEKEAEIIAQAGKFGMVTIATNMAGRGTDIMLGGNADFLAKQALRKEGCTDAQILEADGYSETTDPIILNLRQHYRELVESYSVEVKENRKKVIEAGGLYIVGTERHESRRIDNQLRGRSGRQGDVGKSRFYVSFEDDMIRIFGDNSAFKRLTPMLENASAGEDEPIPGSKLLSATIEKAQRSVEGRNFDSRKYVLKYDDVINTQRGIIYTQRRRVLDGENVHDSIMAMMGAVVEKAVEECCRKDIPKEDWDVDKLADVISSLVTSDELERIRENCRKMKQNDLIEEIKNCAVARDKELEEFIIKDISLQIQRAGNPNGYTEEQMREEGINGIREFERNVLLRAVDSNWMSHLDATEQLKNGIGLRSYAQHDPVVEYQFEASEMFDEMNDDIRRDTVRGIYTGFKNTQEAAKQREAGRRNVRTGFSSMASVQPKQNAESVKIPAAGAVKQVKREKAKVGRNDKCPCGSGKKYKDCCGKDD